MDGISVAASIIGLLQAAAAVGKIVSAMSTAPSIATTVHVEAKSIAAILYQLQPFLLEEVEISEERGRMIYADQLLTPIAGCIYGFSEREKQLKGLEEEGTQKLMTRAKWALKEKALRNTLRNLQSHKVSLNLALTIIVW
jgi:hypothetical protein